MEFPREKEHRLERWLTSREIGTDFAKFKNLILMEEFKSCVRLDVRTHLADRGEEDAHRAAVLADDFVISHQFAKLSSDVKQKQSKTA